MYGLSKRELRFALLISSSHFTQHVFYRILPPLIPVLAVALQYPLWQLGLLITVYQFGMGLAQAPLGILSDRINRRYLLPTGLAATGAGYVIFAFAPLLGGSIAAVTIRGYTFDSGFVVMSLAMVIVGVGLAVVHPAGYPMITDNIRKENKGKVLGVFGASSKLGDAATPAAIAVLILVLSWEQIITILGSVGIIYGVALYLVLRSDEYETVPSGQREAEDEEEQPEADEADDDRRTFLYPIAAMYGFFISLTLANRGVTTFLPAFIVAVYAYSFDVFGVHVGAESVANVYFSLLLLSGAVTQLFLGGLTDTRDSRFILLCCMAVATVGLVALAVVPLHPLLLGVVIVVLGAGQYGVNPARDALVSNITPPAREGRTFGYIFTALTLIGAPFPTLIGYLLEIAGMREGFLLLTIGTILAGVSVALLYSSRVYVQPDVSASAGTSD